MVYDYDKAIHNNYLVYISEFCAHLKEVQRDEPSIPGKIGDMDFQQFSAYCIFSTIKEWEGYLDIPSPLGIDEQKLCDKFKEAAKLVFGDAYDEWYEVGEPLSQPKPPKKKKARKRKSRARK